MTSSEQRTPWFDLGDTPPVGDIDSPRQLTGTLSLRLPALGLRVRFVLLTGPYVSGNLRNP